MIYCKFWELDCDHDLMINLDDIKKHADGTVNPRALERLFDGTVSLKLFENYLFKQFCSSSVSYFLLLWHYGSENLQVWLS